MARKEREEERGKRGSVILEDMQRSGEGAGEVEERARRGQWERKGTPQRDGQRDGQRDRKTETERLGI